MTYLNLFTNSGETLPTEHHATDHWKRLERFLLMGSEDNVYCIPRPPVSSEDLPSVRACLRADGLRVVRTVVETATSGRAPQNTPALQVLAMASSSTHASALTNATALAALPEVARAGADLCAFASFVDGLRGWGRGLRSAIASWYLSKPAGELAFQIMNDCGAGGWTHADLIRLSHPKAENPALNAVFQWAVDGALGHLATADIRHGELRQVYAWEQVKNAKIESDVVRWIEEDRLTHEMIPPEWKQSARVWEALLEHMPYPAMLDQLGKMTEAGLLGGHSAATALVVARLMDRRRVVNAKVHPIALLTALLAYGQSHGAANILKALEDAFYMAMDNVEPSGRRIYLAIDPAAPLQLAAAMAMMVVRKEAGAMLWRLRIGARAQLDEVCQAIAGLPSLSDPSLPIEDARQRALPVDAFLILTGNPGWLEDRVSQALDRYRHALRIPAKLVVAGMTSEYQVPVPADAGQLNIAGFDASVPAVIAEFLRN